jgi:hypothetical protein
MSGISKIKKYKIYVGVYLLWALCIFFIFIGDDYFTNYSYRFDADAVGYVEILDRFESYWTLFGLTHNSLGPILILLLSGNNNLIVFFINISLLLTLISVVIRTYGDNLRKVNFTLLLLLNPLLLGSLLTVNKEILGLTSLAMLANHVETKSKFSLIFSLVLSFITRWQMFFVVVLFYILKSKINPLKNKRLAVVITLCIALSLALPSLTFIAADIYSINQQSEKVFGVLELLMRLQNSYLYFLAVVPKILSNLFGNIFRVFTFILNPESIDINDIYNNVFILGHQLVMFLLTAYIFIRKKFTLSLDIAFFAAIYLIIYSTSPSIQYRYMFPLYIIFCIMFSLRRSNLKKLKKR